MNYLRGSEFGSCSISILDLVFVSSFLSLYVIALLYTKSCLIKDKSF